MIIMSETTNLTIYTDKDINEMCKNDKKFRIVFDHIQKELQAEFDKKIEAINKK